MFTPLEPPAYADEHSTPRQGQYPRSYPNPSSWYQPSPHRDGSPRPSAIAPKPFPLSAHPPAAHHHLAAHPHEFHIFRTSPSIPSHRSPSRPAAFESRIHTASSFGGTVSLAHHGRLGGFRSGCWIFPRRVVRAGGGCVGGGGWEVSYRANEKVWGGGVYDRRDTASIGHQFPWSEEQGVAGGWVYDSNHQYINNHAFYECRGGACWARCCDGGGFGEIGGGCRYDMEGPCYGYRRWMSRAITSMGVSLSLSRTGR